MSFPFRTLPLLCLLLVGPLTARADFPVADSPLETISTEFGLADGPAWDGWSLYIPDVKGQKLFRYIPKQKKLQTVLSDAGRISASFYSEGQLYLSDNAESRIAILKGKQKVALTQHDKDAKPPIRPNDLVVAADGGVYHTLTRQNQVFYRSPSGKESVAVENIETPNGITMSPDGRTLYVSAFVPKKVWAYDVAEDGSCSNGRLFSELDKGPERGADGMAIDRAGNVYCTGPKHVWIWSPDGKLLSKIETPGKPINCTFGDADMMSLYITCFGGVYRQRMQIAGRSPHPPRTAELQPQGNGNRPSTEIPDEVSAELDVVYAQYGSRKLLADIFTPKKRQGLSPAIVVVHGGGWLKGDKTKFRALAVRLASKGFVTAAIEYRLGGEAKFPAGIHDCNAAVRFLRAEAKKRGIDPQRIGAVGGSAGGHLVGLMASGAQVPGLQGDGGHADYASHLQAAIVMAGPMEMITGSVAERSRKEPQKSNSNRWLGKTIDEAPELYRLADAHVHLSKKCPPLLFMVGEHDRPERNQPSREKLKSLGVWSDVKVYEDGKHGCWNQKPWFDEMCDDMEKFFREHLGK